MKVFDGSRNLKDKFSAESATNGSIVTNKDSYNNIFCGAAVFELPDILKDEYEHDGPEKSTFDKLLKQMGGNVGNVSCQ